MTRARFGASLETAKARTSGAAPGLSPVEDTLSPCALCALWEPAPAHHREPAQVAREVRHSFLFVYAVARRFNRYVLHAPPRRTHLTPTPSFTLRTPHESQRVHMYPVCRRMHFTADRQPAPRTISALQGTVYATRRGLRDSGSSDEPRPTLMAGSLPERAYSPTREAWA